MSARTDIVRRAHDALNRGDAEGLAALCAPDFRLDMSDRVFNPEVYAGHDGIRRFMAEVHEVWETFTWELTEVKETDDVVLALVHSVGHARGSGLDIDRHSAMLWRIPQETPLSLTFTAIGRPPRGRPASRFHPSSDKRASLRPHRRPLLGAKTKSQRPSAAECCA